MFDKILNILGLTRKAEVEKYKQACCDLGAQLQICAGDALSLPELLTFSHDVSAGPMQAMHIDVSAECERIYNRFSPGVSGYSWKNPDDLLKWLNA